MCGLVGLVHLDGSPVKIESVERARRCIAHRGPDSFGNWVEGSIGLGHNRLSIIDLSDNASQPFRSATERFVLAYNGEIYNFGSLRSELLSRGCIFKSASDTEVLLQSIVIWGVQAIQRFNGMFAFALWDRQEKRLLLARDRYGIKPLYIGVQGNTFAFASESKAINAISEFNSKIDPAGLLEYFTFQNFFSNATLHKDITIFPPGHYGWLDLKQKSPKLILTKYWEFDFCEPEELITEAEATENLQYLFKQAVARQVVSDVPVGAYLSSGIDSSSIAATAKQMVPDLATFTCGFDLAEVSGLEIGFDERSEARHFANLIESSHSEITLSHGDMERSLSDLAWHIEEPRVGQSYPNFYAAKLAREKVKVILSGAGGDELFGGYPWRYFIPQNRNETATYIDNYYIYWQRLANNSELRELFQPVARETAHVWTRDIFAKHFQAVDYSKNTPADFVNRSLNFEAKTFLHGLLVVEDKISMAFGLESRVPFLDNDLVDFAMSCPVSLKIRNLENRIRLDENEPGNKNQKYFEKTGDGKAILRASMNGLLPENVQNRAKQGFSAPDASWFRGSSIDFVKRTLLKPDANVNEYMNPSVIKRMVEDHTSGRRNRRLLIWSLLNFEFWLTRFEH